MLLSTVSVANESMLDKNSWGIYVTPTTHQFKKGTDYDLAQSNTSLNFALFYNRFLHKRLSLQVEAKTNNRHLDISLESTPTRLVEHFVEIPLILRGFGTQIIDNTIIRIYAGFGIYYALLTSQTLSTFGNEPLPAIYNRSNTVGDYSKIGWLADAGGVLTFARGWGVLLGFRAYDDLEVFGKSEDIQISPLYYAYGIYIGIENRF